FIEPVFRSPFPPRWDVRPRLKLSWTHTELTRPVVVLSGPHCPEHSANFATSVSGTSPACLRRLALPCACTTASDAALLPRLALSARTTGSPPHPQTTPSGALAPPTPHTAPSVRASPATVCCRSRPPPHSI